MMELWNVKVVLIMEQFVHHVIFIIVKNVKIMNAKIFTQVVINILVHLKLHDANLVIISFVKRVNTSLRKYAMIVRNEF